MPRYDGKFVDRFLEPWNRHDVDGALSLMTGDCVWEIVAKAEGIESKPAFRKAFERRRCLAPVDSFYEWRKTATGKQPYARPGPR